MTLRAPSDGENLRQGDICFIKGLPIWNLGATSTQADHRGLLTHFVIAPHRAMQWDELSGAVAVAICSHDCDVENPRSRTGIIVAPLVKVPASLGTDEYQAIMSSGEWTDGEVDYVNLFPLVVGGADGVVQDAVVDFSAMVTIARAQQGIELLLPSRQLTMDEPTREAFRTKIALFFARPYQEPR